MTPKCAKKSGVAGIANKRNITLTLTVTMDGKAVPFQAIYKGKTKQSLPKVTFPTACSLSANMKHHSNTQEVLKHLKEIVIPYVQAETKKLEILINFHVFRGQKTEEVKSLLRENKIVYKYVTNNMTADFQVLNLTVNKWVKGIMMDKFNNWSAETLRKELDAGKSLDEISTKFKLTTMKPLHAKWVIDVFNQLSSFEGKKVILGGWKA